MKVNVPRAGKAFAVATALLGGALFSLAPVAGAQVVYSTDFNDTTAFPSGSTLSGRGGFTTDDGPNGTASTGERIGQSDYVGVVPGYSVPASDHVAFLGGLLRGNAVPGNSTVNLYTPFTLDPTVTGINFNVDFAITSSNATYPGTDSFAFTFRNSSGGNDFQIRFSPSITNPNTVDDINDITSTGGLVPAPVGMGGLPLDSEFHLSVSINVANSTFTATLMTRDPSSHALGAPVVIFNNQTFADSGSIGTDLTSIAATWIINPTAATTSGGQTGAGSNTLIFDNYSITVVPEPSTYAMMGIGFIALLGMMKVRRQRA